MLIRIKALFLVLVLLNLNEVSAFVPSSAGAGSSDPTFGIDTRATKCSRSRRTFIPEHNSIVPLTRTFRLFQSILNTDHVSVNANANSLFDNENKRSDILTQESFMEQPISIDDDEGSDDNHGNAMIVQAVRTVMNNHSASDDNHDDFNFQIMGYLVHRSNHQQQQQQQQQQYAIQSHEALIHCNTVRNNSDTDTLVAVIHKLYKHHLLLKFNEDNMHGSNMKYQFFIQIQEEEEDIDNIDGNDENRHTHNKKLLSYSNFLIPASASVVPSNNKGDGNYYEIDRILFIQHLHEYSFQHRGTEQSRTALDLLGILSRERNSFDFEKQQQQEQQMQIHNKEEKKNGSNKNDKGRNLISYQKQIIPLSVVDEIMNVMNVIKTNGWLSTNADSVDGLPSLHLNLITGGKPLFDVEEENLDMDMNMDEPSFEGVISNLSSILQPYLYDQLLPKVKELCGSTTVEISDVFLRNYGRNVQPSDDDDDADENNYEDSYGNHSGEAENQAKEDEMMSNSRFGLSPHYDVFSSATSVIALDSTAASGQNGLYTVHCQQDDKTFVSSHAGLKEFFPLQTGDGVIHSYDILHGVDVDPNLDRTRTSLIIWYVDKFGVEDNEDTENAEDREDILDQPWLLDPCCDDHVKQFVLALASDCKTDISSTSDDADTSNHNQNSHLYIKSSAHGNAFALNSLAELCDEGLLSNAQIEDSKTVVTKLNDYNNLFFKHGSKEAKDVARALWFESSIRGNRVAQASLADSLMEEYMSETSTDYNDDQKEELLIIASTLFCMSSQQGYEVATEALSRLIQIEYSRIVEMNREEADVLDNDIFMMQPVVQTALVSLQ